MTSKNPSAATSELATEATREIETTKVMRAPRKRLRLRHPRRTRRRVRAPGRSTRGARAARKTFRKRRRCGGRDSRAALDRSCEHPPAAHPPFPAGRRPRAAPARKAAPRARRSRFPADAGEQIDAESEVVVVDREYARHGRVAREAAAGIGIGSAESRTQAQPRAQDRSAQRSARFERKTERADHGNAVGVASRAVVVVQLI